MIEWLGNYMYFLPTSLMRNIKKQNKTNFTNPPIANPKASLPRAAAIHVVFYCVLSAVHDYLNPHEVGTIIIPFCRKGNGLTQPAHGRRGRLPPPAVLCLSPSPHRLGSLVLVFRCSLLSTCALLPELGFPGSQGSVQSFSPGL